MPDDEHESDDLFEDLDKFFAPIKDVEWEEPEEAASPAGPPGEEHVSVRDEPEPVVTVPPAAAETTGGSHAAFEDEDEVDEAVKGLSSLMEPFIIVILGVLIGGIVVSMYLPIFKLGQVV